VIFLTYAELLSLNPIDIHTRDPIAESVARERIVPAEYQ